MSEVENQDINPEMGQEVVNPTTEEAQNEQQPEVTQNDRDARNDRNWRELRKQKEEWERKARMQEELMQRLMSQQQPSNAKNEAPEEDILHEIAREEYVAGEKVAKGLRKIEEKFEKKLHDIENKYQQKQQNSLLQDLKREFPDFDDVVNSETLELLEETNPRLAQTIANSRDPYSIAVQSYEYIKAKGLSNKQSASKRAIETERKIEQNKKTVQSPQAFDKRPMAQAFQLTDSVKKELANEMYQYAQQAGMGY